MNSRENELRCQCAYNTSLNMQEVTANKCDGRKTPVDVCAEMNKGRAPSPAPVVNYCADPCSRPYKRTNSGCSEKPKTATECCKPKSCNENDGGGVMNICDKPRTDCGSARPCSGPVTKCEIPRTCNPNVCNKLNDGCGGFDLTCYGQQFAICTKRVINKCACVKFNGLQDSCKHPSCCVRRGCLDKPFPTCPPARKWRFDNVCCSGKTKKKCTC